ncbi:dihydroflavonol-4-reductase [Pseudomonas sp. SJZ103]|uniref:SDR family oxidoreductase n=1 Tax=unclassified Pseudomonas TaxID=196821 RepID=UPI00119F6F27|nr:MULTISPECIES: aldehyde reductase [unclassified Pseudomonas]MBB6290640.1 dihydroflavonol-4-reductase [Pseudomonas sp. SJZ073]MBB6315632.1 dihydroflavonol-4-reductase [Pseudomonas sp. JAI120]TWC63089.1 dihydroflavonol-4-reductase [Pseudomonas sp. SJZ103]TWC80222.1 dihydroflavonol-4-reductase [Pseudomonas sp. SJZ094]
MNRVLVTGGSGFLGSHCALKLLHAGYSVRATVRSQAKADEVRKMLVSAGASSVGEVEFVQADLTRDDGWQAAMAGCEYVLHVASPFPSGVPKDDNEIILPARDGTLRVLRAARDSGVKRVVVTSSFAAVGYGGKPKNGTTYTELDWTDPTVPNSPYIRSKAIAERAAWDFVSSEGGNLELAVVNPVGIFGPVLGADYSASIAIVKGMLEGAMPGLPDVYFGVVDVRDVADLHLKAMVSPDAKGERFIAVAGPLMSMAGIASILRSRLGEAAANVAKKRLPSWQIRLAACFSQNARQMVPNLGKRRDSTSEKARRVLEWSPRPNDEVIVSTAESLIRLGLVAR